MGKMIGIILALGLCALMDLSIDGKILNWFADGNKDNPSIIVVILLTTIGFGFLGELYDNNK